MASPTPVLALAPMQDVTDLAFWKLLAKYGGPDLYWTEYIRVHSSCSMDPNVLRSIVENPTGRPAIAQIIGNDIPSLVRTAKILQRYEVAAVDLNLGCPAPVVYRKCAGGGLLREPQRVDAILGALRDAIGTRFTVKTRLGFDDPAVFDEFLPIFAKHHLDLLTVHGRTVTELYRSEVHYEYIARAVNYLDCPILANGNIDGPQRAVDVLQSTGARGLMIGRGCIRNPWIFDQIRAAISGQEIPLPAGRDVLSYVEALYEATAPPTVTERLQVEKMKKYLNFLGVGVDPNGIFLHRMRRTTTQTQLFQLCREFLDHPNPMPLVPFPALTASKAEQPEKCEF